MFKTIIFYILTLLPCFAFSQKEQLRIAFYNVENFFDTINNPTTQDDDFTPSGKYKWNNALFNKKCQNLITVISEINASIIGLCEVENEYVLQQIVNNKLLQYKFVHFNSADIRGIDVALLYNSTKFTVLNSYPITIQFPFDSSYTSRDILYVQGIAFNTDTLHFFINHFPSQLKKQNTQRRLYAASVLKEMIDSVFTKQPNANVIVMGDFNDEPYSLTMQTILKSKLYNLPFNTELGTNKYKSKWLFYNQFLVSKSIYNTIKNKNAKIFSPNYLLHADNKYSGVKPFRTFIGYKYIGGYSDHLPIFFDLEKLH